MSDSRVMVNLERFAYTPRGTFGHLRMLGLEGELFTVERPWLENAARVSCIPEGLYGLTPQFFHRGGYPAYEIGPVPGRSHILVHIGNTPEDVEGCVALGAALGVVGDRWAVQASRSAFARFMAAMGGRSGSIVVHQCLPALLPELRRPPED